MNRIQSFVSLYNSESTVNSYQSILKRYFKFIGVDCDEYFEQDRDYKTDVKSFYASIKTSPPKTTRVYLSVIKTFFENNDIELSAKFWSRLKRANGTSRALTQDRIPTREELIRILNQMPLRARALFLVMESSGMRIGETTKLQMDDIELDKSPAEIRIRAEYTKSHLPRTTFISAEAATMLKEWLKVREHYISTHVNSLQFSTRVFPVRTTKLSRHFIVALEKTGLDDKDPTTGRRILHPHTLRKYFRTEGAKAIPVDILEALMGHEGYMTDSYRRYSLEQRREAYLAGEWALTIFTDGTLVQREIESKTSELKDTVSTIVGKSLNMERARGNNMTCGAVFVVAYHLSTARASAS